MTPTTCICQTCRRSPCMCPEGPVVTFSVVGGVVLVGYLLVWGLAALAAGGWL